MPQRPGQGERKLISHYLLTSDHWPWFQILGHCVCWSVWCSVFSCLKVQEKITTVGKCIISLVLNETFGTLRKDYLLMSIFTVFHWKYLQICNWLDWILCLEKLNLWMLEWIVSLYTTHQMFTLTNIHTTFYVYTYGYIEDDFHHLNQGTTCHSQKYQFKNNYRH